MLLVVRLSIFQGLRDPLDRVDKPVHGARRGNNKQEEKYDQYRAWSRALKITRLFLIAVKSNEVEIPYTFGPIQC
jgi:hypothetical protein